MKRIAFTGGRHYNDRSQADRVLKAVMSEQTVFLHGGATGLDQLVADFCSANGVQEECYPAAWEVHGRAAGPIRNREMLQANVDLLIAFPGGRGTTDCTIAAEGFGIPVLHAGEDA